MKIIVPTKGRLNDQLTVRNLPRDLKQDTIIVAPSNEAFWHKQNHPLCTVITQPDDEMGIAEKRKWIVENLSFEANGFKIVMLDDDLRFAVRREDDPTLFRKADPNDITYAFEQLRAVLSPEYPHAGFSARGSGIGEAAQRGGWQEGKRMMYVLGYHVPTVREHAVFGRLSTHEDMDICLQLLGKGFPNKVNFSFVVDQKFGNKGGCTKERTIEINNADSLELEALHPGYVKASLKTYKDSPSRVEVVCQWAKCLKDGIAKRELLLRK